MHELISNVYSAIGAEKEGRVPNFPSERAYRKDSAYERLTKLRYAEYEAFLRIRRAAFVLALKFPEEPSATALSAYCHALSGNWPEAVEAMERTVHLEKGANLDSWMDLGHFLRKIPGRETESTNILLNPEHHAGIPK